MHRLSEPYQTRCRQVHKHDRVSSPQAEARQVQPDKSERNSVVQLILCKGFLIAQKSKILWEPLAMPVQQKQYAIVQAH